jgi:hypothetical protein
MEAEQQEIFSSLLAQNREGELNEAGVNQLDALMQVYRRGLVHKARALKVAVERAKMTINRKYYIAHKTLDYGGDESLRIETLCTLCLCG